MNTPPLDHNKARAETFLKTCIVRDGAVKFTRGIRDYHLKSKCFKDLEGKTVLVNSAFEVFRSDTKIGNAAQV